VKIVVEVKIFCQVKIVPGDEVASRYVMNLLVVAVSASSASFHNQAHQANQPHR
jgi:hypothetical protein